MKWSGADELARSLAGSAVIVVAPSRRFVRVGGPWVAIADWTDSLAGHWGPAAIVTPDEVLTADEVRHDAWDPSRAGGSSRTRPASQLVKELSTLKRDVQRSVVGRRFARLASKTGGDGATKLVFQYHTLFQRAGLHLARSRKVPLVLFVDAPNVWEARQWGVRRPLWGSLIERYSERRILRSADVVVCISDEVKEQLCELGVGVGRILVEGNSVDLERFTSSDTDMRAELDLEQRTVIGWIGGFHAFHRLDLLLDAFALVKTEDDQVSLLLIGDGPHRNATETYAKQLGVDDVVFTGAVAYDDVPRYLRTFDIGVIPAGAEGFHYSPLKLREYLAAGVAVVAPNTGEPARVLTDGVHARLYAPGDAASLANALGHLLAAPALRQSLAEMGHSLCERSFGRRSRAGRLSTRL